MSRVDEEQAITGPVVAQATMTEDLGPEFEEEAYRLAQLILRRQRARDKELRAIREAHHAPDAALAADWNETAYRWRCVGDGWHRLALRQGQMIQRRFGVE